MVEDCLNGPLHDVRFEPFVQVLDGNLRIEAARTTIEDVRHIR